MEANLNAPVIVDLGKTKRKNIKRLREGRGRLVGDLQDAMREITVSFGEQAEDKQFVPVVLVYKRKSKKRKRGGGFFPFF